MKTPSDRLFRLVHAMTAAEKRYLKRHYASSPSHLTILFDFINNMNTYSEQVVKEYFLESNITKNLKVYKVQLTDLILKSLVSYHAKKNIRSIVRQGMEEVAILLEKEFPDLALNKLNKLIKVCQKYDEHSLLFSVVHMKLEICQSLDFNEEIEKCYALINQLSEDFQKEKELRSILSELEDKKLDAQNLVLGESEISFYKSLLNGEMLKGQHSNLSDYLTRQIKANIYGIILKEEDQETQGYLEMLQLFEKKHYRFEYQTFAHLDLLYGLAVKSVNREDVKDFEKKLEKINKLLKDHPILNIKLPKIYHLTLRCYFNAQDDQKIKELLTFSFIEERIKGMKNGIQADIYTLIYAMLFYKKINNNRKGDQILNEIQQIDLDESLESFILILELIDHFKSDSFGVVRYRLAAYNRKVKRGVQFPKFVVLFNEFLKTLIKTPVEKRSNLITNFEEAISKLKSDKIQHLWNLYRLSDWLFSLKTMTVAP